MHSPQSDERRPSVLEHVQDGTDPSLHERKRSEQVGALNAYSRLYIDWHFHSWIRTGRDDIKLGPYCTYVQIDSSLEMNVRAGNLTVEVRRNGLTEVNPRSGEERRQKSLMLVSVVEFVQLHSDMVLRSCGHIDTSTKQGGVLAHEALTVGLQPLEHCNVRPVQGFDVSFVKLLFASSHRKVGLAGRITGLSLLLNIPLSQLPDQVFEGTSKVEQHLRDQQRPVSGIFGDSGNSDRDMVRFRVEVGSECYRFGIRREGIELSLERLEVLMRTNYPRSRIVEGVSHQASKP